MLIFCGRPYFASCQTQALIKEYDLNNRLKAEISYSGDLRDGPSREFFQDGRLASEHWYKNGKRDGLGKVYSEKGVLQFESMYKEGKFIYIKEFDDNGNPINGKVNEYDPAGILVSESNYQDGKLEGCQRIFNSDGSVKLESVYKCGRLISQKENGDSSPRSE
jgi:antitoxin component YwqK of YwqJK toxin-antitoxin module